MLHYYATIPVNILEASVLQDRVLDKILTNYAWGGCLSTLTKSKSIRLWNSLNPAEAYWIYRHIHYHCHCNKSD